LQPRFSLCVFLFVNIGKPLHIHNSTSLPHVLVVALSLSLSLSPSFVQSEFAAEAQATAALPPAARAAHERRAFRAARWQRLRGGGGAWARDGTFFRHAPPPRAFSEGGGGGSGGGAGGGRPGALGPCGAAADAAWPMPGCARAKPYYKLSESRLAYGDARARAVALKNELRARF
jgi:hypothetical protein